MIRRTLLGFMAHMGLLYVGRCPVWLACALHSVLTSVFILRSEAIAKELQTNEKNLAYMKLSLTDAYQDMDRLLIGKMLLEDQYETGKRKSALRNSVSETFACRKQPVKLNRSKEI